MKKCEIPFFLQDKLYADFTNPENFKFAFSQLLYAVGIDKKQTKLNIDKPDESKIDVPQGRLKISKNKQSSPPRQHSRLELFEDLKIIGVDKDKTYNPDPSRILYNVYFNLSQVPSKEWVEIFDAERRFPRHSMWRKSMDRR